MVNNLPHPTSVTCLKLINLPQYSEDWQWMTSVQGLQEIDVSFVDTNEQSLDSERSQSGERLHIHGDKAQSKYMFADDTGNILANLPKETTLEVTGSFLFDLNVCYVCYVSLTDSRNSRYTLTLVNVNESS